MLGKILIMKNLFKSGVKNLVLFVVNVKNVPIKP